MIIKCLDWTIQLNLIIYTPYAVSFVLELTDTKDHVLSVINTKLRSVSSQDWKQQSAVLTTKVKGKILSLLALLTANTNSNVRKTYPVAIHGKTLPLIALKVASELVLLHRDWIQSDTLLFLPWLGTLSQTVNFILLVFIWISINFTFFSILVKKSSRVLSGFNKCSLVKLEVRPVWTNWLMASNRIWVVSSQQCDTS